VTKNGVERSGMSRAEFWTVFLNAAIAIATLGGWFVAFKALRDTQEATRIDERAWFGLTDPQHSPKVEGGKEQQLWSITFTNSGKTPARDVVLTSGSVVTNRPFASLGLPRALVGNPTIRAGAVQPGGRRVLPVMVPALTDQAVAAINDGSATLYVFGVVKYADVFQATHETDFCLIYDVAAISFSPCETFNTMD